MTLNRDSRVVLITKTATHNRGNQALSVAWRDFLAERYPDADVALLERSPNYLKRFSVRQLAKESDPIAAFDAIAASLLERAPARWVGTPSRWDVLHEPKQTHVVRFLKLRQALGLRRRLAFLDRGAKAYLNRVAFLRSADLVVSNPAGEFMKWATDTALAYLLELRCAQLAGIHTAMVNLSFEVTDPTVVALSVHVFEHCDVLEFRDRQSAVRFAEHGGTKEPLVLPDAASLSKIDRAPESGGRGIALAINALQIHADGTLVDKWDQLVPELVKIAPITLTSNEWTTDHPFWSKYLEIPGVTCAGREEDFDDYGRFLAEFDVVISSRLHTCVLGIDSGAAVIPVETGTFKLTGFFEQIGMSNEPIRMGSPGWQSRLQERIAEVRAHRDQRIALQDKHMQAAVARLREGLSEQFIPELAQSNASVA